MRDEGEKEGQKGELTDESSSQASKASTDIKGDVGCAKAGADVKGKHDRVANEPYPLRAAAEEGGREEAEKECLVWVRREREDEH
jgi:hypothetical protein